MDDGELPGAAAQQLVGGVALLHEEDAVVEAMLLGWARQPLARGVTSKYVKRRQVVVRQFMQFCNEYPWNWTAAHIDEWSADLIGVLGRAKSTVRSYHERDALF